MFSTQLLAVLGLMQSSIQNMPGFVLKTGAQQCKTVLTAFVHHEEGIEAGKLCHRAEEE